MRKLEVQDARPDGSIADAAPVQVAPGSASAAAWKRALRGVMSAAFRLHHYRFVRTRMLQDALTAERDGATPSRKC